MKKDKIRSSYPLFPIIFTGSLLLLSSVVLLIYIFLAEEGDDKTIFITILILFMIVSFVTLIIALFSNVTYKDRVLYNKFIFTIKKVKKEEITRIVKKNENFIIYKNERKICVLNEYDKKTSLILDKLNLDQKVFENED